MRFLGIELQPLRPTCNVHLTFAIGLCRPKRFMFLQEKRVRIRWFLSEKTMRYCPKCNARFDEEIIKYCTIDGTELIEEPNFIDAADDDLGQETVIRPRPDSTASQPRERIVVPTEQQYREQNVRQAQQRSYYPPPPPPNTTKTVVLTVIGTLAAVGLGALLFWLFQGSPATNLNVNTNANLANQNTNLNTNLAFDSNFNFNANLNTNYNLPPLNLNLNLNTNANMRPSPTATPSPKPSPTPTPRPSPIEDDSPDPTPNRTPAANRPPANSAAPAGTPRTGPRPPAGAANRPGDGRK